MKKDTEKVEKAIGYARISSRSQNEDRQVLALIEAGVPRTDIYIDKQSGKDFERIQYKKMLKKMAPGVVLYIKSIDRLGRNYEELIEQWRLITKEKGADIVVIDMPPLDTRREKNLLGTFISDLVLTLMSFFSAQELCAIRERQKDGVEAAKLRGVHFGRPRVELPENFVNVLKRYKNNEISGVEAAGQCGLAKSTFYRYAKKYEDENKKTGKST